MYRSEAVGRPMLGRLAAKECERERETVGGWVSGCVDLVQLPKVEIVMGVEKGLRKYKLPSKDWKFY